jgi:spermidine/putrescine transport system ATP-binding protein
VLKKLGQTAVYVTHDIGEAVVVADRIVMMNAGSISQIGTPEEIYHRPRSRYVADFVGNTNVLPARVLREGGKVRFQVSDELVFDAAKVSGDVPQQAATVDLMIRPEYVEIAFDGKDTVAGRINEVEFIGQVTALSIALGKTELRAIALSRPNVHLKSGGECRVRIIDENVLVLSPGP